MTSYNLFTSEEDSLISGNCDLITDTFDNSTVNTSGLITQALHSLNPFSHIELFKPEILNGLDSKTILRKGMDLGMSYELKGTFVALSISLQTQDDESTSNFNELDNFKYKELIFYAGFILEASRRFHIVLSGAEEMAIVLLIADNLREEVLMRIKSDNITLATTSYSAKSIALKTILAKLSYHPKALYTDFDLSGADIQSVKESHHGLRDRNGTGASLAIASRDSITNQELLDALELIVYMA
ncbi:hypothetical protein [Sulfurimonas sp.]|jgi:hypothetical protein|uniref:hypothetical protein n=1 Tax=Sulfurimonas sp. TaxID=2022749 RepID=UPI0025F288B3|nr:hypothetical protein [Sulfurimonas sp.]MBT5935778.1 hypothetical protein [Sulfurimonas sp.]